MVPALALAMVLSMVLALAMVLASPPGSLPHTEGVQVLPEDTMTSRHHDKMTA